MSTTDFHVTMPPFFVEPMQFYVSSGEKCSFYIISITGKPFPHSFIHSHLRAITAIQKTHDFRFQYLILRNMLSTIFIPNSPSQTRFVNTGTFKLLQERDFSKLLPQNYKPQIV